MAARIVQTINPAPVDDPWTREARPDQIAPVGDWRIWLIMAGRGWGKTRTTMEWLRGEIMAGRCRRGALVGATAADVRDVLVEGQSGILACCAEVGFAAHYEPSKRRVTFGNGARVTLYSAEEPNRLRGPEHDCAVADELGAWEKPETWDMLMFGLRLPNPANPAGPRVAVATTPKPVAKVRDLVKRVRDGDAAVVFTAGRTIDNAANLDPKFLAEITETYAGTRMGRQELDGELLEDVPGAFWTLDGLDRCRRLTVPELKRITVAVDPATTYGEDSDQTGVAVVGGDEHKHKHVLHAQGYRLPPDAWADKVIDLYIAYDANDIVFEGNQGGELVRSVLTAAAKRRGIMTPKMTKVHAKDGKRIRAEPVVVEYEAGRVHHVGTFPEAEAEMCGFPVLEDVNDDIVDAVVHGVVALTTQTLATARSY